MIDMFKKFLSYKIFLFMLFICSICNAQERVNPTYDTEVVRNLGRLDIDGNIYYDVKVTLKAVSPDHFISDKYKVVVTVKNKSGKKVWKKSFKNAYLYLFSEGKIMVGQHNFCQLRISWDWTGDHNYMEGEIREKEGIFKYGK